MTGFLLIGLSTAFQFGVLDDQHLKERDADTSEGKSVGLRTVNIGYKRFQEYCKVNTSAGSEGAFPLIEKSADGLILKYLGITIRYGDISSIHKMLGSGWIRDLKLSFIFNREHFNTVRS